MSWAFFRFKYRHKGPQPENFSTQTYTQLPASKEDICNRIEWSKALRQGKYPSILLSLYLEMNKHYYDRMDVSSFSSTFGVKVIKEIFFSPHKLYVYCYRKLHLTSLDCFGSLSMATRLVFTWTSASLILEKCHGSINSFLHIMICQHIDEILVEKRHSRIIGKKLI